MLLWSSRNGNFTGEKWWTDYWRTIFFVVSQWIWWWTTLNGSRSGRLQEPRATFYIRTGHRRKGFGVRKTSLEISEGVASEHNYLNVPEVRFVWHVYSHPNIAWASRTCSSSFELSSQGLELDGTKVSGAVVFPLILSLTPSWPPEGQASAKEVKAPHLARLVITNDPHGLRVESQDEDDPQLHGDVRETNLKRGTACRIQVLKYG